MVEALAKKDSKTISPREFELSVDAARRVVQHSIDAEFYWKHLRNYQGAGRYTQQVYKDIDEAHDSFRIFHQLYDSLVQGNNVDIVPWKHAESGLTGIRLELTGTLFTNIRENVDEILDILYPRDSRNVRAPEQQTIKDALKRGKTIRLLSPYPKL